MPTLGLLGQEATLGSRFCVPEAGWGGWPLGQAYAPLTSHCDWPSAPLPRYTRLQVASRTGPVAAVFGRSMKLKVAPPSVER